MCRRFGAALLDVLGRGGPDGSVSSRFIRWAPRARRVAMCVACIVDEKAKERIIAYRAEFHRVTKSPFGTDDEIGMLSLVDARSRAAILARANASKVFDVSVDHLVGMPGWFGAGDQPYQIWMTHTPAGEIVANTMGVSLEANALVAFSGDAISMYTHCGTHIDTFNHFGYNGRIFNGFSATEHLGSRTWQKCGAEKYPPIFARGSCSTSPLCTASTCCRRAIRSAPMTSRAA
jgi:hypothetical protein